MNTGKALDLIQDLSGNEYDWVDFKQDYDIGGIAKPKAEFAKDVASLANGLSNKSERYILVGCDDDGQIVGIDESRTSYRGAGPRHIFSFDEADIQQTLQGLLDPLPDIVWHEFKNEGKQFGVLVIEPSSPRPCVIDRDLYDDSNNRLLSEGRIYVRRGSSKVIAKNDYIKRIIDHRVSSRRDEILEGIHKAVEVGPEAISHFSGLITTDDDEAVPISIEDDAEYEFQERVSREPTSNLDSQLNGDIVRTKYRGDDFIDSIALWEYYAKPHELTLDEEAVYFLTQSAIKRHLMGLFWLEKVNNPTEVLQRTEDDHHRLKRAVQALTILGKKDHLDDLISDYNVSIAGEFRTCSQKVDNTLNNRFNYLLNSDSHQLKHNSWKREFSPKEMDAATAKSEIPSLANQLGDIQETMNEYYGAAVSKRDEFRNALWDLELVIGREMAE